MTRGGYPRQRTGPELQNGDGVAILSLDSAVAPPFCEPATRFHSRRLTEGGAALAPQAAVADSAACAASVTVAVMPLSGGG